MASFYSKEFPAFTKLSIRYEVNHATDYLTDIPGIPCQKSDESHKSDFYFGGTMSNIPEFLTSLAALITAIAALIGAVIAGIKIRIEWLKYMKKLEEMKS